MALRNGWPAVSGAPTQFDIRQDLAALVFRDSSGNVRSGIVPPVASPLVTPNSDMTVTVGAFVSVLNRLGPVFVANDGPVIPSAFASAPSSNSRIDLLWVMQRETAAPISDPLDWPYIGITTGTASATPSAPSAPIGAMGLYTAQIPAGASTMASSGVVLTPVFPYTCVAGGPLNVRSSGELSAIPAAIGQEAYELSTGYTWRYGASGWGLWTGVATLTGTNYFGVYNAAKPLKVVVTSGQASLNGALVRTGGPYSLTAWSETPIGQISGVKPGLNEVFLPVASNSATGLQAFVKIIPSGAITLIFNGDSTVNTGTWANLAGITFPVAS